MVDANGAVVILKNNAPRYVLIEYTALEKTAHDPGEGVEAVAKCDFVKNLTQCVDRQSEILIFESGETT